MTLQLFDFIAQCVSQFLAETTTPETSSSEERLPLGFVFPFTCRQTQLDKVRGRALSQAVTTAQQQWGEEPFWCQRSTTAACSPQAELLSWSKGFSCSGVVGKDVVQMLQSAINKQEVGGNGVGGRWLSPWRGWKSSQSAPGQLSHVDVVALMNDTVGTMMTCCTEGRPCEIAMVAGEAWAPRVPWRWVLGGLRQCSAPSLPQTRAPTVASWPRHTWWKRQKRPAGGCVSTLSGAALGMMAP